MSQGRFDDMFFTICQESGGLNGLFETLFSFMYRRTDFYYEADPGDKMGFPPGQNFQLLMKPFTYYQEQHYKTRQPKKDPEEFKKKLEAYKAKHQKQQQAQKTEQKNQEKKVEKKEPQKIEVEKKPEKVQQKEQKKPEQKPKEEQKQGDSVKIVKESEFNTYNGGTTENYKWSQTIADVTVEIPLKQKTRPKELKVVMTSSSIDVKYKDEQLIKGEFYHQIKADESLWSIEDETKLVLNLEKATENIWKTIIKGDKEIDATKVDNTKKLETFDGETQGAIRKIMYEQQRKQMGLPTTEQESQLELMKKAWDAEGSPFRGQPFDPSKLNLQDPGINLDSVGGGMNQ